jgi:hypothetical protein
MVRNRSVVLLIQDVNLRSLFTMNKKVKGQRIEGKAQTTGRKEDFVISG